MIANKEADIERLKEEIASAGDSGTSPHPSLLVLTIYISGNEELMSLLSAKDEEIAILKSTLEEKFKV